MKIDNLVSIILPCYNSEETIKEAIESVLNQTYLNWELIIIDDCSEDTSYNVIKNYLMIDTIIYFKNKKNLGVSESRNIGIKKSSGEYIAFLDSDDIWDKCKLEKQIRFMKTNNLLLTFTSMKYINYDGNSLAGTFRVKKDKSFKTLRYHNSISTSSVIVKKNAIGDLKMVSGDFHEDYLFWLSILKKNKIDAVPLDDLLVTYRFSKNSKSSNKLKSFKMTYRVYRILKIKPSHAIIFTLSHLVHSSYKHLKIFI
ncbi:glycosyltransferase family 2 protein [Enterococcus italicus]